MKKLLVIIALVLSCVCLFVACDTVYQSDADYHWVDGNESAKAPHAWDKGEVTKEATATENGERRFTCTVCGYQITQEIPSAHTHTYAHGWSSDKFGHWHAGTCEHAEAQGDFAEHVYDGGVVTEKATSALTGTVVYTCTVCDWQKTEEIAPDHTDHIWAWNTTVAEHWQEKACCASDDVKNRGEHTYDENYVCTVCGQYSVIEAIKSELANKQSGTFVVSHLVLPAGGITINELAINFAFDSSANLVGQAYLDFVKAADGVIELDGDEPQGVRQTFDVVLRDGTFYVKSADYKADGVTVARTGYSRLSAAEALKGLLDSFDVEYDEQLEQQIVFYSAEIINTIYAASDDIKAVLDVLEGVAAQLPDMSYAQILESYFKPQTIDGVVYYRLDWDVLRQLNNALSQLTIGDVLKMVLGQNDISTLIPTMVTQILNTTMGDIIDGLKEQGVDLYELNEQINAVLAGYGVTLESIIKNNFDLPIADGLLIADYLDSILIRPYKVIDLINIMVDSDTEITVEQIVGVISDFINKNADVTVYDVVANLTVNYLLETVNRANVAADMQCVRNLNTMLLIELYGTNNEDKATVIDGFIVAHYDELATTSSECEIYWHAASNSFVLVSTVGEVKAVYTTGVALGTGDKLNEICENGLGAEINWESLTATEAENAFTGESMRYALNSALTFLWDFVVVRIEFNDTLTAINGWHVEIGYDSTYVNPEEPTEYWSEIICSFFDGIREMLFGVSGKVIYGDSYTFTNSADSIVNDVNKCLSIELAA